MPTPLIEIGNDTTRTDSIRRLVPKGYYLLTELGAKKALKADVDAKVYFEKWQIADQSLGDMSLKLTMVTTQRNQAINLNINKDQSLNTLASQLKLANAIKWTAIGVAAVLGVKVLIQ